MKTAEILKKSVLTPGNNWISLLNSASLSKKNTVTPVNFHLYHYASNNPIKYTDPDGRENFLDMLYRWCEQAFGTYGADYLFENDTSIKFMCTVDAAANGDEHAQELLKYAFHEASREVLKDISEKSGYMSLVCLAIGCPEGSTFFGGVSIAADGILAIDDFIQGNYEQAKKEAVVLVAGIIISKGLEAGAKAISKSIHVTVGSNGKYYEIGRRGAIKTEKALRKLLAKDIASGYFGQEVIPNAPAIIEEAIKAFRQLNGDDDE